VNQLLHDHNDSVSGNPVTVIHSCEHTASMQYKYSGLLLPAQSDLQ